MNFAVELVKTPAIITVTPPPSEPIIITNVVKTGDESRVLLFSILALVSGIGLLIVSLCLIKKRNNGKGEKKKKKIGINFRFLSLL